MKKEIRLSVVAVVLSVWVLIINIPGTVFALGEYDGVWAGSETINVPDYGLMTETTGTVIYQENLNTLNFWDSEFGSVDLIRFGNEWKLDSPLQTNYMGYAVTITSMIMTFSTSNSSMTGTITAQVPELAVTATGTFSHTKQTC